MTIWFYLFFGLNIWKIVSPFFERAVNLKFLLLILNWFKVKDEFWDFYNLSLIYLISLLCRFLAVHLFSRCSDFNALGMSLLQYLHLDTPFGIDFFLPSRLPCWISVFTTCIIFILYIKWYVSINNMILVILGLLSIYTTNTHKYWILISK